jgi:hypothetical protein
MPVKTRRNRRYEQTLEIGGGAFFVLGAGGAAEVLFFMRI